jgi:hypothetical protein
VRSSVAHAFLAREVGDASIRVTVVLTPDQRRTLAEELPSGGGADSPASAIRAGALGVKLGPVVSLDAVVSCESAAACAQLGRTLGEVRDARARDFAVRVVGFGALLEQVEIKAEGELVHARVELPAEQAATLAERLVALRGMRHPMPGPESPAEPPTPDEIVTLDAGARRAPAEGGGRAHDGGAPR